MYFCLFEQSGTFKNALKRNGQDAKDYDILNNYGETDCICDLFGEIEKAYDGEKSIFDEMGESDTILAFFPCTRFENQIILNMRGENYGMKKWTDLQKLENSMRLQKELSHFYDLVTKLCIVCMRGGNG